MGISLRAYGRHRGVSEGAVRKAIRSGRITLEPDGTINPEKADKEWLANTDIKKQRLHKFDEPNEVVNLEDDIEISSDMTFSQAKTTNEIIKAKSGNLKFQKFKGEVVSKTEATMTIFQIARQIRDALLNYPARVSSIMAADLNADAYITHITLEKYLRECLSEILKKFGIHATNHLYKACYEGLEFDPQLTVSGWADKHRLLSSKAAAEPGLWRTDRTPYLREIMDNLSPHSSVQRVVFMKGAQIGGTEAGNNWIGYVIHMNPGPMLSVSPTVEMAKRNSKQRIEPLIEDSEVLKTRVKPSRARDSGNTILAKEFPGGVLVMTGANSAVGLRSMPARYLFMDEIDGYPGDVEGEGDPILLAERRSATFQHRRKIFLVSTPTTKGLSRIQREFEASDQRYYHVPCPHCSHYQQLRFSNLRWTEGKPEEIKYQCENCEGLIEEHHKTEMLAKGKWVATKESDGCTVGYHLSSLYSPTGWFSWKDTAKIYEQAKQHAELMKGFINTVLGEPFEEEHEAPEWQRLYEQRETYPIGIIPKGGLFLTCGVDVQKDRIECEVVAWGRNKESWSVDYIVLPGCTAREEVWQELDKKVLQKDWPHIQGNTLPVRVMAIDSGYATQDVYAWVRKYPQASWGTSGARANAPGTVVAIKGQSRSTALILSVSKADTGGKRYGLRVWNISAPIAKTELYRWLKLKHPTKGEIEAGATFPAGSCHFPEYEAEYFKQLTAEKRIIRIHKGFPKAVWEKDPSRNNEALDARVYARAAASIFGLDRFHERHWQQMEEALGKEASKLTKLSAVEQTSTPPEKRPFKLVQRPVIRSDHPCLGDIETLR